MHAASGIGNGPHHAKYEAWIEELQRRVDELARSQKRAALLFVLALISGSVGFAFSPRWGFGLAVFWTIIGAVAHYLILMYRWDYRNQIERARADLAILDERHALNDAAVGDGAAASSARLDAIRGRYDPVRIPRRAVLSMPWSRER